MTDEDIIPTSRKNDYTSSQQEGIKLWYDLLKHITVMASGSIVIIGTFWENFGTAGMNTAMKLMLVVSVLLLLVTVAAGIYTQARFLQVFPKENPRFNKRVIWGTRLILLTFLFGIVCLSGFIIGNVFAA